MTVCLVHVSFPVMYNVLPLLWEFVLFSPIFGVPKLATCPWCTLHSALLSSLGTTARLLTDGKPML